MPSISIVGIGRVGGALAIALSRSGFTVDTLVHRDPSIALSIHAYMSPNVKLTTLDAVDSLESDVILITTTDPDIHSTAQTLANKIEPNAIVLHTSGSLSSEVIADVRTGRRRIGSLHPLVSVSDPIRGADNFNGVYFCVEGDAEAAAVARSIVEALGGRTFSIEPEDKALYHAAAVMSAGHITALIDVAISMLSETGVDPGTAREVLLPLVRSTVSNLDTQSPRDALTGPFTRADVAAIERHLKSFRGRLADRARDIYLLLGEHSLDLAESNGVEQAAIERIRETISIAKRKSGC